VGSPRPSPRRWLRSKVASAAWSTGRVRGRRWWSGVVCWDRPRTACLRAYRSYYRAYLLQKEPKYTRATGPAADDAASSTSRRRAVSCIIARAGPRGNLAHCQDASVWWQHEWQTSMGHRKPAAQDGSASKREAVSGRPADILQKIVNDNLNYQVESLNYMLQQLMT